MTDTAYPDYIEILKLRKAHPIYQIAALILGIDPRTLKLMPDYHEGRNQYEYLPESKNLMYFPVKAADMPLDDYLRSESANSTHVPLHTVGSDLGQYAPSMRDVLFQELKRALVTASNEGEVECLTPGPASMSTHRQQISEDSLVTSRSVHSWLLKNNFSCPFFEAPKAAMKIPELMDKNHPNYAPELAIAVEAWIRFSDLGITHPKEYVENWLDEMFPKNTEDALSSVSTSVSNSAKERITQVMNWKPKGGANSKAYSTETYRRAKDKLIAEFQ